MRQASRGCVAQLVVDAGCFRFRILTMFRPKLDDTYDDADPTKHIRATAQFAEDMAEWLHRFSTRMRAIRESDEYQKAVAASTIPPRPEKKSEQGSASG